VAPAGARGQRRASQNHNALVFPWGQAGPQAFRLPLRRPLGFGDESGDPGRCFRESRRHPRPPSKLLPKKRKSKEGQGKRGQEEGKNRPANLILPYNEEKDSRKEEWSWFLKLIIPVYGRPMWNVQYPFYRDILGFNILSLAENADSETILNRIQKKQTIKLW